MRSDPQGNRVELVRTSFCSACSCSQRTFRMTKGRNGFWSGIIHSFLGCKLFARVSRPDGSDELCPLQRLA